MEELVVVGELRSVQGRIWIGLHCKPVLKGDDRRSLSTKERMLFSPF